MSADRKFGGRTVSRFEGSQRHYHQPFREETDEKWDEWTGDKASGPFKMFMGGFLQMVGTVVLGAIGLAVLFFGVSFFWKLVLPMISK